MFLAHATFARRINSLSEAARIKQNLGSCIYSLLYSIETFFTISGALYVLVTVTFFSYLHSVMKLNKSDHNVSPMSTVEKKSTCDVADFKYDLD